MRFRYYNILWVFLIGVIIIFWALHDFQAAKNQTAFEKPEANEPGGLINGNVLNYDNLGNLRTSVSYQNGIKHGTSYLYYPNGNVQLEMPYLDGQREGTSKKYYQDGSIYAETTYANDLLNGIRKTYYSSGKPKANISYFQSFPGIGLIEYNRNEEAIVLPAIRIRKTTGSLELSTTKKCRNVQFYLGRLVNDRFFDKTANTSWPLPRLPNGSFLLESNKIRSSEDVVVCMCTTKLGNPLLLARRTDNMQ